MSDGFDRSGGPQCQGAQHWPGDLQQDGGRHLPVHYPVVERHGQQ